MIKEHAKINIILQKYLNEKNMDKAKDRIRELRWALEKHFFSEEKAIFELVDPKDKKEKAIIATIIKGHEEMRELTTGFVKDILENTLPDLTNFKKVLFDHEKIEVKLLYPRMDKEISGELRREILKKAKES